MITNVLVNAIAGALGAGGLTAGVNLFAENGRGDQYVVVKTTTTVNPEPSIDPLRESPVQVLIVGWDAQAGFTLANNIWSVLKAMSGPYTYGSESYTILEVAASTYPVPFQRDDRQYFSMNVLVTYTAS